MSDPIMQVEKLTKRFPVHGGFWRRPVGWVQAVDGVSLRIDAFEVLALVGESGCGKSTLARAILRLTEPTSGQVRFRGQDLTQLDATALRQVRRHLQIVLQDPTESLNPRHTVADILTAPMRLHGLVEPRDALWRAMRVLSRVGLSSSDLGRFPHELSVGQQQRVAIARAVSLEPDLVVCDEPVSALDVSVRAQICNLLLELREEVGLCYLFITHDLSLVHYLADRVAVMYLGRIVEQAPTALLFADARHPYTQALLATLPGSVPWGGRPFSLMSGEVSSAVEPPSGCHFHPRCPLADARCRSEYPPPHQVGDEQWVACHLAER